MNISQLLCCLSDQEDRSPCLYYFDIYSQNLLILKMSENDDEADPYLQYQQLLTGIENKGQPAQLKSALRPESRIQQIQESIQKEQTAISLVPCKKQVYAPLYKDPPRLISGLHNVDETIKRPPQGQFMSPQYQSKNEQTRNQIRMKIVLENNRLKGSIQSLRKELNEQRGNDVKIASILKESKEKISDFKYLIKEKSKKISELAQKNIALRSTVGDLQEKLTQLTSYSNWQETQIRNLKKELQEKCEQKFEGTVLQNKIEILQNILKDYEVQFSLNTFSRSSHEGENPSSEHLQDRASEHWGTINQMDIKDIEGLKHRDINHDEDYQRLTQMNTSLKIQLNEVQRKLELTTNELNKKNIEFQRQGIQNLQKLSHLQEEIGMALKKSLDMNSEIKDREEANSFLQEEILRLKEELQSNCVSHKDVENKYQLQILQLNRAIASKQEAILKLTDNMQESQRAYKKEITMLQLTIEDNKEKYIIQFEQMQAKLEEISQKNLELENNQQNYQIMFEFEKSMREEHEEREKEAREFLDQRKRIEEELASSKDAYAKIKDSEKHLSEQLAQAQESNRILEEEKNQYENQLNKYAKDINDLKILLGKISRNYSGDQQEGPIQKVIEEQEDEQQDSLGDDEEVKNQRQRHQQVKIFPQITSRPLEEQEELSEPLEEPQYESDSHSHSSDRVSEMERQILSLKRQMDLMQRKYKRHIEILREEFRIEKVELEYQYEQEKENDQRYEKVEQLSNSVRLLQIEIRSKRQEMINIKKELYESQANLEELKNVYDGEIKKLKTFINNQSEELKVRQEHFLQLETSMMKQIHDNGQLSKRLVKIEEEKKDIQNQKLKLLQRTVDLEGLIQKIKYDHALEISNRNLMQARQLEKLKSQLQTEIGSKIEEENKLYFSQQFIQKQQEILIENKKKDQKIEQMKLNNEVLTSTNDFIKKEMESLRAKSADFEKEAKQLEKRLKEKEKELDQLQLLTQEMKEQSDQLSHEKLQQVESRLELERIKSENQVLKCQLESNRAEYQTTKSKLKLVEEQMKSIKREDQKSREDAKNHRQMLENIIQGQKSQIQKTSVEKLKQAQKFTQLRNQNKTLLQETQQLKGQISNITNELDELKTVNEQLKSVYNDLNKKHRELEHDRQQLQEKLSKTLQDQNEREFQLMNLKMSLELSQTSHKEEGSNLMSSLVKEKQSQLTMKLDEIDRLNRMMNDLRVEMSQLQCKQREAVQSYESKIRQQEEERESLILKNSESHAKIQELNQSLFSFSETVKLKGEQLEQKQQSLTDLESLLNTKKAESEEHNSKIEELEEAIRRQSKDFTSYRDAAEKEKKNLEDQIQISKKTLHQIEDEYVAKVNKLNKELANHKFLLSQVQKDNSFKLEQSNRSITNIKNELKVYSDLLKQKEEEIREIKSSNISLKESNQKMKKESSRFQEEKAAFQSLKEEKLSKLNQMEGEISLYKRDLHRLEVAKEEIIQEKMRKQEEVNSLQNKIKEIQLSNLQLNAQKLKAEGELHKIKEQTIALKEALLESKQELTKTQNHLHEEVIQKTKIQYQSQMFEENLEKMKEKLYQLEEEKRREMQVLNSSKGIISTLEHDKEQLSTLLTSIEKEHSVRMESLRQEQRDHYLLMERKYTKEVEELCEQLSLLQSQRDSSRQEAERNKKGEKDLRDEIEGLKQRIKQDDEWLNDYQDERARLNERIAQLTQENNEVSQVTETLRSDIMLKNDQIYDLKEQVEKLVDELNRAGGSCDSNKSIPLSIETDRVALQDMIQKQDAVNRQLLARIEIVQNQLNQKTKKERDQLEQLQKYREKECRDRQSSMDSKISRSKIFADQKSESLESEVQNLKLQLESAQAYIAQLEDECKEYNHSLGVAHITELQAKVHDLQKQNEQLKMKVDYQQAYIQHLQTDNIKNSIISKRSTRSKKGVHHLQVQKDHSVISYDRSQQMQNTTEHSKQIYSKINMINEFIQTYKKDNVSMQKQQEFRKTLNNPYLDELLNTIFYKLQKEANTLKEKEHEIAELEMENEQYLQEIKSSKDTLDKITKKIELYDNVEKKYEETRAMLEESLMLKLKYEANIAESKRYIQELQNKMFSQQQNHSNGLKLSARKRGKEGDNLSVLKEANEEEESESVMDPDLQSEMPSQMNNSKQFGMSLQMPMRTAFSQRLHMDKVISIEGQIIHDKTTSVDFLQKLLDEIDQIQSQTAYIQLDLQEKRDMLAGFKGDNNKSQIVQQLQQIESKVSQNDKEMKNHLERSEQELISLIRDILKYREAQDQYGLQTENRQKIEECLNILERELEKSSRINMDDRTEEIKFFGNSNRLNSIREDLSNEDKGSSMASWKAQGTQSRQNESQEVAQLRKENSDLVQELQRVHNELTGKEGTIIKMNQITSLVSKEIATVFDDILVNFQDNRYLLDQLDSIKRYLAFVFSEDNLQSLRERNPSPEKLNESGKMILVDSKRKSLNSERRKPLNHFQQLLRLSNAEFLQMGEELTNDHVKILQKRLEETTQLRYQDCMDFLLCEESLILSILKISEEDSAADQTMERLASKFTKQEMANIIQNCHNPVEARNILKRALIEDQDKSLSAENDFSPDPQKLQDIRQIVYPHPSELCLSIHNQLLSILTAPTKQVFYDLIELFYKTLRRFEDSIKEEADERDSRSQSNSIQMKKILKDPVTDEDFKEMEKFKLFEYKNLKGRSGSCRVAVSETNVK